MIDPEVAEFYKVAKEEVRKGGDYGHRLRCSLSFKALSKKYTNMEEVIEAAANSIDPLEVFKDRVASRMREYYSHDLFSHPDAVFEWEDGAMGAMAEVIDAEENAELVKKLLKDHSADELMAVALRTVKRTVTELKLRDIRQSFAMSRGPMHLPWFRHEARAKGFDAPRPTDLARTRYTTYEYDGWVYVENGKGACF